MARNLSSFTHLKLQGGIRRLNWMPDREVDTEDPEIAYMMREISIVGVHLLERWGAINWG